jgi:hypothetical protein
MLALIKGARTGPDIGLDFSPPYPLHPPFPTLLYSTFARRTLWATACAHMQVTTPQYSRATALAAEPVGPSPKVQHAYPPPPLCREHGGACG